MAFYRCNVIRNHWCHMSDVFQTLDTSNIDGYKLNNLVEQFNLNKELIT